MAPSPEGVMDIAGAVGAGDPRGGDLTDLNGRSRDILRAIVDAFVETGEPIGSRTISRRLGLGLSPATIRNVMSDLEEMGLLRSPHTSAGRLPTDAGLRLFVDGLLEIGDLSETERAEIEARCRAAGRTLSDALEEATLALSGLSRCAGLVVAPKTDRPLKHIEFVPLSPERALFVLVTSDGVVENRVVELPPGLPQGALVTATNYMNARLRGRTLAEMLGEVRTELDARRAEIDALTASVVSRGLATYAGGEEEPRSGLLIVKGQSRLLDDLSAAADLERLRELFEYLETRETMMRLLDAAQGADGVQIYIGAENAMFGQAGWSMVLSPYRDSEERIVGAIGVIGPTRINYARIVPMVDYTAKIIGRLIPPSEGEAR